MNVTKRFVSNYELADVSVHDVPIELPVDTGKEDCIEASYEIRVEHIRGEAFSIIENEKIRNVLYSGMKIFVSNEPCLPPVLGSLTRSVVINGQEYSKPEGEILIDAIRGGISAYTAYPVEIFNFIEWQSRINDRLKNTFKGNKIRAYVKLDDDMC